MEVEQKSSKKRNRGHNKRICFNEETVTKSTAESLLSQEQKEIKIDASTVLNKIENEEIGIRRQPKKPKQKNSIKNDQVKSDDIIKPKKRKRNELNKEKLIEKSKDEDGSVTEKSDNSVSKRSLKRLKKQQMEEAKKIESDIDCQKKALNYLSNWKYNKSEWKFEKLRQIWLVQNLYNDKKIDAKYWDTLLEYFTNSQGKVRQKLLDEAVKIVENDEDQSNEDVKLNRARDIVQNL